MFFKSNNEFEYIKLQNTSDMFSQYIGYII